MLAETGTGLFWFLLPVAALSGWFAARRHYGERDGRSSAAGSLAPDYFRGLNYLLDEQPDKAIEVFINLLDVDGETVEMHLAVGNLFRRKGEVDRAIRIHQNLIAKRSLSHEQRCDALRELAMDYMRSGLLDRAESLFRELLEQRTDSEPALRQLVQIYQQEQDWDKAIEVCRRLEGESRESLGKTIAHFLCEKAEQACGENDFARARELVCEALRSDASCVRASLIEGRLAMREDRYEAAISAFQRIASQDPAFLPEAISTLVACYRHCDRVDDARTYLEEISRTHVGITPVLALAALAAEAGDLDAAMRYISEELRRRPSVRGLDRFLQYALATAGVPARDNLNLIKGFTSQLLEGRAAYRCAVCGFTGRSLHWQCPSCKSWNTVKPIQGIEGE
ncbi:MAG: lipopolysaccharide assembly protein LapB [Gammaproteobacteria bacterium]|nr:lipopolysaccharide assembly protein LapB [Gammaproteobacteria bacterium]